MGTPDREIVKSYFETKTFIGEVFMWPKKSKVKNCGFTLVELLVVIAIIALLLSILMPSLQKAKQLAQQVVCGTRDKQLGLALMSYTNDYDGWIMPVDTELVKGATSTSQVWQSPSDLDPKIKIADHQWYGILWSTKGMDNRDVFFCPSTRPANNKQLGDLVKDNTTGRPSNVEEVSPVPILGLRQWAYKGGNGIEWANYRAPKRLSLINKPSDFFLVGDCVRYADMNYEVYRKLKMAFAANYKLESKDRSINNANAAGIQLRHNDKAGAVFADGHAEFKAKEFWLQTQDPTCWQVKYDLGSTKVGYRVFTTEVKGNLITEWYWLGPGQYIKRGMAN
jgi:prepilin-type N-terminal cleavage/methylation domain-containing protein/prepilin-type processing-associated H-X9-DG protein